MKGKKSRTQTRTSRSGAVVAAGVIASVAVVVVLVAFLLLVRYGRSSHPCFLHIFVLHLAAGSGSRARESSESTPRHAGVQYVWGFRV